MTDLPRSGGARAWLPATAPDPAAGRRSPWLAAAMTLFCPGLGHVYAGRPWRGVAAWLLGAWAGAAALLATLWAGSPAGRLGALAAGGLALLAVVADAARTARRADPAAARSRLQRPAAYVGLAIAILLATNLLVVPLARSRVRALSLRSENMAPTLLEGDYVMAARGTPPMRRGIVVTRMTDEGFESVVRMVALAGDTVAMRQGRLRVNGRAEAPRPQGEPAEDFGDAEAFAWQRAFVAGDTAGYAPTMSHWGPLVVPPGHVFVLGDNRPLSLDSRHLGFIPHARLTGRVAWIYFSRDPRGGVRWGRIGRGPG